MQIYSLFKKSELCFSKFKEQCKRVKTTWENQQKFIAHRDLNKSNNSSASSNKTENYFTFTVFWYINLAQFNTKSFIKINEQIFKTIFDLKLFIYYSLTFP